MNDTDGLKRLAEDLRFKGRFASETEREAAIRRNERNDRAADAILALIAENERLKAEAEGVTMQCDAVTKNCFKYLGERDEAVALLRECVELGSDDDEDFIVFSGCRDFLARVDNKS